jgi:ABC-type Fe3+/spermidine/putrescine transport system ATPase subunit
MLELRNLSKSFENMPIVQGVSLEVADGEILALLGPSGSGKSTLLSLIAGLESPDAGQILWDGRDLAAVPAHQRGFGLMFQDFALFPHRNVGGNVAFGLELQGKTKAEIDARVREVLDLVNLGDFARRDISTLSGGEQQRVALARALAPAPRLLMLDEPLGSLDRVLADRLLADLVTTLRAFKQTSIYVTHDRREAFAVADRIAILNAGKIAQIGTPGDLYQHPASAFVARFLGMNNIFSARALRAKLKSSTDLPSADAGILLRPDGISIGDQGPAALRGTLRSAEFQGSFHRLSVELPDLGIVEFELPAGASLPKIGDKVSISFDPKTALQVLHA